MKNLWKKLTGISLGAVLALGAGVAFSSAVNGAVEANATAGTVTLSSGTNTGTTDVPELTWAETYWTVKQCQGLSGTKVNASYISAPRMYKGHYLTFEAPDGVTFDSIVIKYSSSSYPGSDISCGYSTSSGYLPVTDATGSAIPTNANGTVTTDTTALTVTTGDLASAKSVFIQDSYAAATSYKQLRPTAITINYTSTIVVVNPTSLTVSFGSSTISSLCGTTQATATVLPENATDKSVTWSSSNTNVAVVSTTGVVTGLSNGTATITAVSKAVSTVSNTAVITVSADVSTVLDKTVVASNAQTAGLNYGGYPTSLSYFALDGVSFGYEQFGIMSADATVIQGKSGAGHLYNISAYSADIKTISIVLKADGTSPFTLNVGSALGSVTTTLTPVTTGAVNVYTPAAGMKFFDIGTLTATAYISAIVVELVDTDVEAARTLASAMVSDFATYCVDPYGQITDTMWDGYASSFEALNANGKAAFTSEAGLASVTNIQKVLPTYKFIVNTYGKANFLGISVAAAASVSTVNQNANATVITVIVSIVVLSATALAFSVILRKKKAE